MKVIRGKFQLTSVEASKLRSDNRIPKNIVHLHSIAIGQLIMIPYTNGEDFLYKLDATTFEVLYSNKNNRDYVAFHRGYIVPNFNYNLFKATKQLASILEEG